MRRLPPLNALRAYEAAARHLSFTKAAEELNVTPGAISQQIKALEDYLGVPVFKRQNRTLLLTEEAQSSLPIMRDAFDKLATAASLLASGADQGKLTVSVAPSFASKWLVPRLDSFQAAFPDIDVYVHANMNLVDFAADDVDVAIRYGGGTYDGLTVHKLMEERIIPVASPALMRGEHPLHKLSDLAFHTLLHDGSPDNDEDCPTWPMWLRAAGAKDENGEILDGTRGPRFNQSSLVIEAAVAGKGVALAKSALALADLEAARLVIPFDFTTTTDFAYYVVHPPAKAALPQVKAFVDWVLKQAEPEETPA
ncbi:transcriptional regulator GcvA [Parvularcula flava]|uniref:Transcriptional regulator GcvA n=1 Tax=Aquisalinus luteolus TaxID=1566827 RepID=A0ABX0HMA2_9PROT|nr:transcriptional regulator GcvA [Aquisalinus luteolus]NHK28319.1 transcriptional regulator GcvA [Aquisalinus luteolus]